MCLVCFRHGRLQRRRSVLWPGGRHHRRSDPRGRRHAVQEEPQRVRRGRHRLLCARRGFPVVQFQDNQTRWERQRERESPISSTMTHTNNHKAKRRCHQRPQRQGHPLWLMAFVCMEQRGVQAPHLLRIYTSMIRERPCPSILTDLLLCYFDARDNQTLIETAAAPPPPSGPHIWLSDSQSPPSDYTGLNHWWINVGVMEQWTSIHFLLCTAITSVGYVTAAVPASFRYRHWYYCHWHFWVSASDSHRGEGWSIVAAAVTTPVRRSAGAHAAPRLPQGPESRSNPAPSSGCEENCGLEGGLSWVDIQQVINPI